MNTSHMAFTDLYPVATADMTTEDLVHEATETEREFDRDDCYLTKDDLTRGTTYASIRYLNIRTELRHRGVIA